MSRPANRVPPAEAALVMYSGGLDSTVAAIQMARRFRRVVLMSVDYAYTINYAGCARNVPGLQAAFPDCQIEHRLIDGERIRRAIWDGFCHDYARFCRPGGAAIICLGCKMAMMVEGVRLCLAEGLGHLSNGMTRSQIAHPHNAPSVVNRCADFMAELGITYLNDVYDMASRAEEEALLAAHGLDQGVRIGASSVTHQPRCFLGPYTKLWLTATPVPAAGLNAYFDSKLPVMRALVADLADRAPALAGAAERTVVDEDVTAEHTFEFSPTVDRAIARSLSPLYWLSRGLFAVGRRC